ncbi:MAG: beta-glucanase precursor [Verrucomicrobiota bacterium]
MKIPSLLILLALGTLGKVLAQDAAPAAPLDFGDFNSATLTSKAWKASEAKDFASAVGYAAKCIETHGAKAVEQQKALTAPLTEKEQIFAQWALNDVGTCYFIQGQVLEKQGKTKEAIASYKYLVDNLAFAQCWDTKGWFWKPAGAAAGRIKALEFDAL